jgi:hypothetical protein
MRRFTVVVVAALMLVAPTRGMAKSGYVRVPEPRIVRAGPPIPTDFGLSAGDLLGGCGAKRYRDAATHRCRGPADLGN